MHMRVKENRVIETDVRRISIADCMMAEQISAVMTVQRRPWEKTMTLNVDQNGDDPVQDAQALITLRIQKQFERVRRRTTKSKNWLGDLSIFQNFINTLYCSACW